MKIALGIMLPLSLAGALAAQAERTVERMRCGHRLVGLGDHKYEVLDRCGEPDAAEIAGTARRRVTIPYGPFPFHRQAEAEVVVDQWVYDLGQGRFLRILWFEGGRLTRIELGPRQ